MAKQSGMYKIVGTIGDLTFLRTENGYEVRQKSNLTADRIATDPAFQRTRENMAEFGHAGYAGKVLRTAVRTLLQNAKDGDTNSRLYREMMRVVHADTTSARGARNVIDGDLTLLQDFDFNNGGKLGQTVFAQYSATIDRVGGTLEIVVDPYEPVNAIAAPQGTTHFKILSMGAEVDFNTGNIISDEQSSAVIPYDANATAALTLTNAVTANSTLPLFLVMGVQFYQEVNGLHYQLKNGSYNALNIVKVNVA